MGSPASFWLLPPLPLYYCYCYCCSVFSESLHREINQTGDAADNDSDDDDDFYLLTTEEDDVDERLQTVLGLLLPVLLLVMF